MNANCKHVCRIIPSASPTLRQAIQRSIALVDTHSVRLEEPSLSLTDQIGDLAPEDILIADLSPPLPDTAMFELGRASAMGVSFIVIADRERWPSVNTPVVPVQDVQDVVLYDVGDLACRSSGNKLRLTGWPVSWSKAASVFLHSACW